MKYKDGTNEPQRGDTVQGDKLKGQVVAVKEATVSVRVQGPYNPRQDRRSTVVVERDPVELRLVRRASTA